MWLSPRIHDSDRFFKPSPYRSIHMEPDNCRAEEGYPASRRRLNAAGAPAHHALAFEADQNDVYRAI